MTESTILENKKLIHNILDLQSEVIKINRDAVTIDRHVLVEKQYEMDIDLISKVAYGTNEAIDILCKFNGISNPLSIKAGDVIFIPNLNSLFSNMKKLNYKSMTLSKSSGSLLKTTLKSSQTNPSKKQQPSKNFTKSNDGIIIF
ncbi:hypothetical protein HYO65_gp245 [Tenacibaculum phage PTm1]|uniref:LysM domain-containing protein n=2 Tax=Shirahamavirus PTm1 TaxID=2846435 RepID=A0A5S9HXX0_9CAUD|nr:hypothetical protein HYO65_gp245 [Tenacibaculum phage PTm1]BBI90637.1 hypothetical protein [Tenacibaculum phage PTm1]BBI90944.1 hypothetical protein [Tenacibaculum phage PTm5]